MSLDSMQAIAEPEPSCMAFRISRITSSFELLFCICKHRYLKGLSIEGGHMELSFTLSHKVSLQTVLVSLLSTFRHVCDAS